MASIKSSAKRIKAALAGKFETKQTVSVGGAVGNGKIFIGGQLFDGTIAGTQEVVNAGRPAAAKYVAKTGGGTVVVSGGSAVSTGGGGGGSDYLPRSGALAMLGVLDMGAYAISNVGNVDGRDVSADGTTLDGIKAATVLVLSADATLTNERALVFGTGFSISDGGAGGNYTVGIQAPPTLSVSSVNDALARSHAITTSNNPGAAASILASSSAGNLTLPTFVASTKITTPLIDTASGNLTLAPVGHVVVSGTSAIDGSAPVTLTIDDARSSSSWSAGAVFSQFNFDSQDASGSGVGTKARVAAFFENTAGSLAGLSFYTNAGSLSEKARITSGGNVLVGTTTDGGYKLDVNGTMRAATSLTTPLITATGDLIIDPVGVVQFPVAQTLRSANFTGNTIPQIAGWQINQVDGEPGNSVLTIHEIQADELAVKVFVADETRIDRGNQYWAKSFGILAEPFTVPALNGSTVTIRFENSPALEGQLATDGDWFMFQHIDRNVGLIIQTIWGQVSDYIDDTLDEDFPDTQRWTFTLRHGNESESADIIMRKGRIGIDFGASGQSSIQLSTVDSSGSPYFLMRKWEGANPYSSDYHTTLLKIGNLNSGVGLLPDYITDPSGYGLFVRPNEDDEKFIIVDDGGIELYGVDFKIYNGSDQTVDIASADGTLKLGVDISDAATTSFDFSGANGSLRVGLAAANKPNINWDATSGKLALRSNTTEVITMDSSGNSYFSGVMTIGTSGEVRQGTGALGTDYTGLRIWRDTNIGRIAGYNNNVLQWYGDTNGKLLAGTGSIFLDADGATLVTDTTATHASQSDAKAITFERSNGTLVGRLTSYYVSGGDDYGLDIYTRAPGTEDAFATIGAEQAGKTYAGGAAGYPRVVAYSASSGTDYLRLYGENIDIYTDSSASPSVEFGTSSVTFNQAISVTGNITVSGTVDGVDVSAIPATYLALTGGTLTNTLTSRTIAPSANNTYDVGSSSNYFNNGYIRNLYTDTIVGTPSYSHTHSASDITSGTLADARIPTTLAGRTFSSAVTIDADTGLTSNYIRWLTQTSTGKAWDLIGRAHDHATSAQQNDLLLTFYDGSTVYNVVSYDSGTRVADFAQTPTVGGTAVSLSTHDHSGVYVPVARTVTAGSGMIGGGALSSNITISHDDTSSQSSVNNSGSTFIQDVTLDTFGHVTALTSVDVASTLGQFYLGASTTGGTTDWNDSSNTTPNSGTTLLSGSATNGPGGSNLFHPINFEYNTKTGVGNITQWAVPYGNSSINAGFFYRGRFSGSWSSWYKIWTETNDGPGSGMDSDTIDGIQGSSIVQITRLVSTGAGLSGGGALSGDLTLSLTTPGSLSVSSANSSTGSHTHAITSSSAPGAAASLLASNASGILTLPQFVATTKVRTPLIDTASGNLALTPAGGTVTVTGAGTFTTHVGVGTASPEGLQAQTAITDATRSVANVRAGTIGGYPRIILDGGTTATMWQIDNNADVFRVFRSGNVAATIGTDNTATLYGNVTSPDYASQVTGWRIDTQGGADFRYVYTDELHAKAFIADLEQALAGGQIITKSVTILATTFFAPMPGQATTLTVQDLPSATGMQVFQSGDMIRLRTFSRASGNLSITNCWGVVTSPADNGNGTQTWTFTRSGTPTYSTIAHRNTQTQAQSSSTTVTITKPTSTASGDCLIASIAYVGARDVVPPAGWNLVRTQAGTNITLVIYQRTAGGSEGSNYTFTFNVAGVATATNSSAAISGYTNCYAAYPVDISGSQPNSSSTSMVAPAVTPGSNAGMLLFIGAVSDNTRATAPASMTERADAGSSAAGIYVADQLLASNVATGAKTATLASAETTAAALIVLMPNYTAMTAEAGAMIPYSTVEPDAIVLDYGVSGNGYHEVNAIDGIYAANSPYSQTVTWTTHPATGSVVRTRLGNLSGLAGATAGEYGLYAGDGASFASATSQFLRVSTVGVQLNNVPIKMYSGGTQIISIDTTNGMSLEVDTADGDSNRAISYKVSGVTYDWMKAYNTGGWHYLKMASEPITGLNNSVVLRTAAAATKESSIFISTTNAAGNVTSNYIYLHHKTDGSGEMELSSNTITVYGSTVNLNTADLDMNGNDILLAANIASRSQTIAPSSTSTIGMSINMPTSTSVAGVSVAYNGTAAVQLFALSGDRGVVMPSFSNGSSYGPYINIGRNSNGSTPSAGHILMYARTGTYYSTWVDNAGNLRIMSSAQPTNGTDTNGVVVGTQSSALATKNVLGEFTDYSAALQAIVDAPLYDFTYKSGSYNGEKFTGIITDYAPTFGMDGGKSLNVITAHGYSMAAIKALHSKIEALETQVAALQNH